MLGIEYVFDSIGISLGYHLKNTSSNKDISRVKSKNKKSVTYRNRRKQLRSIGKKCHDSEREKVGSETYFSPKFVFIISLFAFFNNLTLKYNIFSLSHDIYLKFSGKFSYVFQKRMNHFQ